MTSTPQVTGEVQPGLQYDSEIPSGLNASEKKVYETLLKVRRQRTKPPPDVFVITDIAKDYDDLVAMILLKEMQRLGLIRLKGFITNLLPAQNRAAYGRGALDSLGLQDIPIAWGQEAISKEDKKAHKENHKDDYEFVCSFNAEKCTFTPDGEDKANFEDPLEIESGSTLLHRCVLENSIVDNKKVHTKGLTFLLISSLDDISTYTQNHEKEFLEGTARIVLQGGYNIELSNDKYGLEVDFTAMNNRWHHEAAEYFHNFIAEKQIPSIVYTKIAASAAGLSPTFLEELKNTGHVLGEHLLHRQVKQDLNFFENPIPEKTKENFLETKTTWFEDHKPQDEIPVGAEVLRYVKIVLYDVLAALDTAGEDVMEALDVLMEKQGDIKEFAARHRIVGKQGTGIVNSSGEREKGALDVGINVDKMKVALTALLKGSLLSAVEKGFGLKENYSQATESGVKNKQKV